MAEEHKQARLLESFVAPKILDNNKGSTWRQRLMEKNNDHIDVRIVLAVEIREPSNDHRAAEQCDLDK
jgi:hypothetical protein